MRLIITSFLIILITATSNAKTVFEVPTINSENGSEKILLILPDGARENTAYPMLIAPGNANPERPMFFWGTQANTLGWIIVQTKRVYRGSHSELKAVIDAVQSRLAQQKIMVEGIHMIGWSANSGRASSHVANMPGVFKSLSLIPGYGRGRTVELLCRQKDLRYMFITGSRDRSWLSGAEAMRNALNKCGVSNLGFEVIEGGGHVLEEISGTPLFSLLEKNRN
jgi:hypothetical protein